MIKKIAVIGTGVIGSGWIIRFLAHNKKVIAYDKNLKIASSKHDLTAIRIIDPAEEQLPDIGLVQLQNPETGAIGWVDTSSSLVRLTYEKDYQNFVTNFKSHCTHSGTDYLDLRVDRSYTKQLLEFFKRR